MEKSVRESNQGSALTGIRRRNQRGEGKLKAILYTAVLVAAVFSAVKILPAYVNEYQLSDKIQETARFAVVNRYTEEQVRDEVYKTVQDLSIPAKREDIKVTVSRSLVTISLDYTVPVDLLVYQLTLHFTPSAENKSLI
jgi:cell division protein FtsL